MGGGDCLIDLTQENDLENSRSTRKRRGYLNPETVRAVSFWTTSACVLVAVVASLLAIWQFTGTDVLWRTVATCVVIGGGTVAFYLINVLFDKTAD
jgi:membrane protein YdbS with pleckstrin-like domain